MLCTSSCKVLAASGDQGLRYREPKPPVGKTPLSSARRGWPQHLLKPMFLLLLLWLSAPSAASASASALASSAADHGRRRLLSASNDVSSVFNSTTSVFSFTDFEGASSISFVYQLGPWTGLAGYRFVQNGIGTEPSTCVQAVSQPERNRIAVWDPLLRINASR